MKELKIYIKQQLVEATLNDALKQISDILTVNDVIKALEGKLSKERFKKVGLGIIKFCALGTLDIFDAIGEMNKLVDSNGVIKDSALDKVREITAGLGIDGLIKKLKSKPATKRHPFSIDPYYVVITDENVEKEFYKDYITYLKSRRGKLIKDLIKEDGDITSLYEEWLRINFDGRTLDTEKEDQNTY